MYRAEKLAAPAVDRMERSKHYALHIHKLQVMQPSMSTYVAPPPIRLAVHRRNQQVIRNLDESLRTGKRAVPVPPIISPRTARSTKRNTYREFNNTKTTQSPKTSRVWGVTTSGVPASPKKYVDTPSKPPKHQKVNYFDSEPELDIIPEDGA